MVKGVADVTHYHGTPVWGDAGNVHRIAVTGAGAFVSYARPDQLAASIKYALSVAIDNGAFSAWKRGLVIDWQQFYQWLIPYYHHPKLSFFVIPDVVEGGEADTDALIAKLPRCFNDKAAPVWHLQESLHRLVSTQLSEPSSGIAGCQKRLKPFTANIVSQRRCTGSVCSMVGFWVTILWRLPIAQTLPAMCRNSKLNIRSSQKQFAKPIMRKTFLKMNLKPSFSNAVAPF